MRKSGPDWKATVCSAAPVAKGQIWIGVGGWTYAPWRGIFYPSGLPQKRELEYASRQVTSIEINGTFYGSRKPESFARWHDETPDDFVFSLKAPRFATNRRILAEAGPSIERFFASGVAELKTKLGPINWQFAPTKQFDRADFSAFLKLLPQTLGGRELRHAIEVRHDSFRSLEFLHLAREHNVAIVISGDSNYPLIVDPTAAFVYARIMGTQETPRSGYATTALDRWADRAKTWSMGGIPDGLKRLEDGAPSKSRDVYLYVIGGSKVRNPAAAMALIERIR